MVKKFNHLAQTYPRLNLLSGLHISTKHTTFSNGEIYISLGKGKAAALGHPIPQPPFAESELHTEHTTFSSGEIYTSLGKGKAAALGHHTPSHRSLKVNCILNTQPSPTEKYIPA